MYKNLEHPINKLAKFENIENLDIDQFIGKNVFCDIEGGSKTTAVLTNAIRVVNAKPKGEVFIVISNTIKGQKEMFEESLRISNVMKIDPKDIHCILSTTQLIKELIQDDLPGLYKAFSEETKGNQKLVLISIKGNNFSLHKNITTFPKEIGYEYRPCDSDNLKKSLAQLRCRLNLSGKNKTKCSYLALVINDEDYHIVDKLMNWLQEKKDSHWWEYDNLEEYLTNIFVEYKKSGRLPIKFDPAICEIGFITQARIGYVTYLVQANNDEIGELINKCDSSTPSRIIIMQSEKFSCEFEDMKDYIPKARYKYMIDHFHIVQDEIPNCRSIGLSIDKSLKVLSSAIHKNEKDYTNEEYGVLKQFTKKQLIKIRESLNSNVKYHELFEMPVTILLHSGRRNSYLNGSPIMYLRKSKNRLIFNISAFKNTLILTTEKTAAAHLGLFKYKLFQKIRTVEEMLSLQAERHEVKIIVMSSEGLNPTKKNDEKMKNYVEINKSPISFTIGKKSCGCDSTLESVKGTNKLYKDKNLKYVNIILGPPNPGQSYLEFSDFYKNIGENDIEDLFKEVAISSRIDQINQALGRTCGMRKIYRKQLGYDPIINFLFVYEHDDITMEALKHSRYINPDIIEFKELNIDPNVYLEAT